MVPLLLIALVGAVSTRSPSAGFGTGTASLPEVFSRKRQRWLHMKRFRFNLGLDAWRGLLALVASAFFSHGTSRTPAAATLLRSRRSNARGGDEVQPGIGAPVGLALPLPTDPGI